MASRLRWRDVRSSSDSNASEERTSSDSYRSYSTAPTVHSDCRPHRSQIEACIDREGAYEYGCDWPVYLDETRASVDTYTSTVSSDDDLDQYDDDGESNFDVDEYDENDGYETDTVPASPRDFAALFPSSRLLSIHHDDSTLDGNMNLRVDTQVESQWSAHKQNLSLFHLKMNDLASRNFSLRRYCRESGREVCKSARKYYGSGTGARPAIARSLNSVLQPFIRHHSSSSQQMRGLKQNDSRNSSVFGYHFGNNFENGEYDGDDLSVKPVSHKSLDLSTMPTNTIKLEFSNYAQVDLKARGIGTKQRHIFEYWGCNYIWRRTVHSTSKTSPDGEVISFHLHRSDKPDPVAHIVPVPLTREQALEEASKGGWVPPCSMWITAPEILGASPDIADLVIATGLVALVDDSIKRRLQRQHHDQKAHEIFLPVLGASRMGVGVEYVGPKALIDAVFHRSRSTRSSRGASASTTRLMSAGKR